MPNQQNSSTPTNAETSFRDSSRPPSSVSPPAEPSRRLGESTKADGPARAESAQFTLPERYQLIRPLKSHPNSRLTGQQTLLAMDLIDERRVIIQALPTRSLSDDGRFRFQQHLRATSRIRNSFFLEPTDWQPDGNYLYRARRYVRAMSLEQLMRRAKSNGVRGPLLPLDQCVQFTRGLLETLREIHSVDCVRQDFRLSQILIHGNQPRLIAAGPDLFVAPQQRNERWSLAFSTVASPELSGLIEHDIDSASDLYSIGVVLFCLLAGHPPFEGQKLGEVLCQHLTNVPDLSLISHAPEALVRIIERLLAKQPQDRYQSASAVLHDLDQVEKIENGQLDASEFVLGRSDRRETIIDSAFVGRRKELRAIENSITEVRAGQCQTMIVQSDSGIGKTRLIVESLRYASAAGLSVYRGCASSQASQKPAAALISVFQQIIPQTHLHSQLRADLQEYLAEITIALPEMARAIGWETETPDQHRWGDALDSFGLNRINQAYCKILNSIASPESPALVWIDDCQWLDPQTIEVLSELRRRSPAYTMIMLSSRTDGSENLSLFEALEPTRVISLGPLADVDVQAMIESMAGHLPLEAIRTIVGLAAGNPFMAAGVLRGMVETGALVFGNMAGQRRWTIDPHRMTDIQASSDSADALMKRLDHVSDAVLELLSTAAVIGKEFRLTTLGQLLDQSAEDTAEHLSWCREKRLVWRQPDGSYAFVHDRIQETLIGRLPDDRRMSLHLRYGEYLLSKHNSDDHTLAYHFNEAGRSGRALPYALRAAKSARQSYSLEAAIQSLRIAVRGIGLGDQDTFRSVAIDLAEALMLKGQYHEADQWFQKASLIPTSIENLARIDMQRGELAFRRGDKQAAVRQMEQAIDTLGMQLPTGRFSCIVQLIGEVAIQALHTLLPKRLVGTRSEQPTNEQRLVWRLFSRLAHGYWYTKGREFSLLAHLRGMNQAEKYPATPELAQAWSEHAPAMSLLPWKNRGTEYAQRSLKVREQLQDVWGQGQSRGFFSILLHATSQFDRCIQQARQAESILERTGDYWEVNIARYQLASALYRRGELKEAAQVSERTYQAALKIGDFQSTGNIIDVWVRASNGKLPDEIIDRERNRSIQDQQAQSQVLLAEGVYHVHREQFDDAVRCFQSGIEVAEQANIVNAYTTPNYAWLATALRMRWDAVRYQTPAGRHEAAAKIQAATQKAIKVASRFRNDLPHAWREHGYALALDGRERRARQALEKSIRIAKKQGAKYELALSEHAYGILGQSANWPDAEAIRINSRLQLNAIEGGNSNTDERDSISLVDRFDSLLDAGRKIASSLDQTTILELTRDAAKHLLRGERTLIVERADANSPWTVPGETTPLSTHELNTLRALSNQNRTLVRDQTQDAAGTNPTAVGSLLVSPIRTQGDTRACLLVSNSLLRGIYGDNETRIADYLTSAAGSALEKADGFQQLATLNQSLEEKVKQRTELIEARSRELEQTADTLRATQTKLESARDDAQAANVAKSEFLARMSHEIRTPISAVLGFTELILRGVVKDDAVEGTLQTIHGSGHHLLQLVNDLLDLSKIEANKLEVERIEMVPARLVHDVITTMQARAAENGNTLSLNIASALPETINSDPKRFQQIVTNVVGNAIKFTSGGSISVNLRLAAQDNEVQAGAVINSHGDSSRLLEIEVIDSGIGMTQAQVQNVFDPFVQADSSVTRRFGGTGLGLSISKQLAESLGGNIQVTSQPDVGSTFTIRVDAGKIQQRDLLQPNEVWDLLNQEQAEDRLTVDLTDFKVFVADDAETNRDLLELILTDCGATVELVENGREAVKALTVENDFDVVLMDMQMPVLDGYSAVVELRDAGCEAPIIALTANTMKGDRERCLQAGCSDYLSKPIDMSQLLSKLADIAGVKTKVHRVTTRESTIREAPAPVATEAPTVAAPQHENSTVVPGLTKHELPSEEPFRSFSIKFLGKLADRGAEFIEAIEARDQESVAELAHWATGTSGTVGLTWLSEHLRAMEHAAKDGKWAQVDQLQDLLGEFFTPAQDGAITEETVTVCAER